MIRIRVPRSQPNYTDGRFPVKAIDAIGNASYSAFDPLLGVRLQSTDINGINTCQTFDAFGNQLSTTTRCGSATPVTTTMTRYEVSDPQLPLEKVVTVTRPPTGAASFVYADALGRSTVTRTRHFNGGFAETDTVFDVLGRVSSQSTPHLVGDFVYTSVPFYDALNRVTTLSQVLGPLNDFGGSSGVGLTTNDYSGGFSVATSHVVAGASPSLPPVTQTTTTTKNVAGKVVGVTDAIGTSTIYSYDSDGNLTDVSVGGQTLNHVVYDLRGRQTSSSDADLGGWSYTYDAFGDVLTQTDAKNQVTTMAYDQLGRMVTKTDAGGTAQWIYDTASGAGKGKVAFAIGEPDVNLNGSCVLPPSAAVSGGNRPVRSFQYTPFGDLDTTSECVDGEVFPTTYQYDALGRQSEIRYPPVGNSQLAVGYHYTSLGFLQYLTDNSVDYSVLWQVKTQNALGQVLDEQTGNGVETVSTRNPTNGWLLHSTATAHADGDNLIQWLDFAYDELGNLRSRERQDHVVDATSGELFTYDRLNRLLTAETKVAVTPFYDHTDSYTYDVLGNISLKNNNLYGYGTGCLAGGQIGPHTLCSVGGGTPFGYDANGNMTSSAGRSVNYNAANKPAMITSDPVPSQGNDQGITQFVYGADTNRVVQIAMAGSVTDRTVYIGGGNTGKSLYERTTRGNMKTHVDFIYSGYGNGGSAFAVRTIAEGGGATVDSYFHTDNLGSTMAISDGKGHIANASGPEADILGYDPWGARRNPDGQAAVPASFNLQVGHREYTAQETIPNAGLINMNGRVYDPIIGRFFSPDPNVQFAQNLQSYNRYSYVLNNPLSYGDPTGYFLGLSGIEWLDIGLTVASIAACTGPQAASCGLAFAIWTTAANVTAVALSGGSQNQIAATAILGGGFGALGGAFGFAAGEMAGDGIAGSLVGGAVSTAITATLGTVFSGGNLGENLLVAFAESAVATGASYALAQQVPVSDADAAAAEGQKRGSGGSLSPEDEKIVARIKAQSSGEGVSDALPLSHADRVKVDAMIASGNMNEAIEYLRVTYGLRQGGTVAVQTDDGLYSRGRITIGKTGYSWKGDVSAEWLYSTLSHENVHVAQEMYGRLFQGQQHELNEIEAYAHDLRSARAYGLNQAQVTDLAGRLIQHYNLLQRPELALSGQWKIVH